jgi:hypothetical protein
MNPHPSYQTAPLHEYGKDLRDRATLLFQLVEQRLPANRVREYNGSFSVLSEPGGATVAKIAIYQSGKGSFNGLNPLNDGIYVCIRVLGEQVASTIAFAPHHEERFAYFSLTDTQDLEEMAGFLSSCANITL